MFQIECDTFFSYLGDSIPCGVASRDLSLAELEPVDLEMEMAMNINFIPNHQADKQNVTSN